MVTFQQGLKFSAALMIPISVFLIFLKFIKVKTGQKPSKNNEREPLSNHVIHTGQMVNSAKLSKEKKNPIHVKDTSESQKMEEFDTAKTVRVNDKINNTTASPNEVLDIKRSNKWQCACEGGLFLPSSMLKSFSGAEAVFRMGSGQCYHKQL